MEYELSLGPQRCENCQRYVFLIQKVVENIILLLIVQFILLILNIYRAELDGNFDPYYQIDFEEKDSRTLSNRKMKHIVAYSGENSRMYCLCRECSAYLDRYRVSKIEIEFGWCSYVWCLLSNSEIHEAYGNLIWRYIPIMLRPWWLRAGQQRLFFQ